jgi:regulatory protein
MKTLNYDQALQKAGALCSQSEKCPNDIFQKALSWGLSEKEAARLVGKLTDEGFLDEARYARAFVNDKFRFEHWGKIKIAYALRGKGIDDAFIDEAFDEKIDPEEYLQTCVELLSGKLRSIDQPLSQADRARLFRFAAQRGFETFVISKALTVCTH